MTILKSTSSRRIALIGLDILNYAGLLAVAIFTLNGKVDGNVLYFVLGLTTIAAYLQGFILKKLFTLYIIAPFSEEFDEDDERDVQIKNNFLRYYNKLNEVFIFAPVVIIVCIGNFNISSTAIAIYFIVYKLLMDLSYLGYFYFRNIRD